MTIKLAVIRPARAKSGRRYFRGTDKTGAVWWLLEEADCDGRRWVLKVDPAGSFIAPEDMIEVHRPKALPRR